MSFEKHLFISYAHIDNEPLTAEEQGWITRFHADLEALLSMRMGSRAAIWRDDKLRGNDIFSDEILDQFPETALLMAVLTPRYIQSEWCTREVKAFCRIAQETGGVVVDNKARVIKVIKTPVDTEDSLPKVMKEALGYPFYIYDDDETPLELDPIYGQEYAQAYHIKVGKLAWDLSQLLKKLQNGALPDPDAQETPAAEKPAVYLAECSYERREERELLEATLKLHGYTVLPDQLLPREETAFRAEVKRLLARCRLSIHLIGTNYGMVPDGPTVKSAAMLQNEQAVLQSKQGALQRVIWVPEGTRSDQPEQQAFIDALHQNAEAQYGADLLTGNFEALKGTVHAALKQLAQPPSGGPPSTDEDRRKMVYVLCDGKDRKEAVPLVKFLRAQGLDVNLPVFTGDATAVREANGTLLKDCDALLFYYGAGDEVWKFHQQNEVKKWQGFREGKPLLAQFTYLAAPVTEDKELMVALEEPNLINGLSGFSEAVMEPFKQAVNPG